jgi:hypothetical protein
MERLSTQTQESGFLSMHSQRSSSQSYTAATTNLVSKRLSQQSSHSYNSQSVQSYSQQRLSTSEANSNGSTLCHKSTTLTSSRSVHSTSNVGGDQTFMEKLVNLALARLFAFLLLSPPCPAPPFRPSVRPPWLGSLISSHLISSLWTLAISLPFHSQSQA